MPDERTRPDVGRIEALIMAEENERLAKRKAKIDAKVRQAAENALLAVQELLDEDKPRRMPVPTHDLDLYERNRRSWNKADWEEHNRRLTASIDSHKRMNK